MTYREDDLSDKVVRLTETVAELSAKLRELDAGLEPRRSVLRKVESMRLVTGGGWYFVLSCVVALSAAALLDLTDGYAGVSVISFIISAILLFIAAHKTYN